MNVPGAKAVEVNQYRCRSLNVMQTKSKVRCARAASIFRASHSKSGPQQPRLALLKFKTRSRVRRVHTLTNEFMPVNFQACLPLPIALHIACATQPVAWGGGGSGEGDSEGRSQQTRGQVCRTRKLLLEQLLLDSSARETWRE